MNTKTKKTELATVKPTINPKRTVEVIDIEHLEDVIGGNEEAGAYPLRMSTSEEA